jgi:lipopolysaccharide/colanic/teichoic acid biosynthesis glycosyltransferase
MNNIGLHPLVLHRNPGPLRHRRSRWWLGLRVALVRHLWRWSIPADDTIKRAFDVAFSAVVLLCISPLLAGIALLIKLEDRGPVLFRQVRVGRHGREFFMLKFRSMRPDAEQRLRELLAQNQHKEGVTFKIKNDPRVTRIGYWLRKFSLDELPQFWNVLIGDMSVVGPRPPVPREVALYTLADRRRLAVQPGITCIWQVSGRAQIDFHGQVELDVRYIETRSFWKDLCIISKTLPAVLSGNGAY